jgi:cytochrome c5
MNRRTIITLVTALLVLLLGALIAACGQTQPESTTPPQGEATAAPTEPQAPPESTTPPQGEATAAPTELPSLPPALDGRALLEERCTRCHDLSRVEQAHKTTDEWRTTVERMVGKGASLTPEEQGVLIQYLAETYPK